MIRNIRLFQLVFNAADHFCAATVTAGVTVRAHDMVERLIPECRTPDFAASNRPTTLVRESTPLTPSAGFALQRQMPQPAAEVGIIGAGSVGLTMAAALIHRGMACRIIEKAPIP